jgi:protein O-GlcNAc transferase
MPTLDDLKRAGRLDEAIELFRREVTSHPQSAEAHYNLGSALQAGGRFVDAIECYHRALAIRPDLFEAHNNLGTAAQRLGKIDEAMRHFQRAVEIRPDSPEVHNNLGMVLHAMGRWEEAAAAYLRSLEKKPNTPETLNNLGHTLQKMGKAHVALETFRQAMRLRPDSPGIVNNLGNMLKEVGRLDEAIACYDRALQLRPDYPEALSNLANVLKDSGRLDMALEFFDKVLKIRPDSVVAHSGKCYAIHFHPDYDAAAILKEHQKWNEIHAAPLAKFIRPHENDRSPDRRLRIGYVSSDFYDHVVGRFMLPLLANHDHQQCEVFCYAGVTCPDEMTTALRGYADVWRDTVGWSDEKLAEVIHQDGIDILIDLTMHMGNSRLLAFARKPAPVQVTYLAYCSTTGLAVMDYRLTDPYLDEEMQNDECRMMNENSGNSAFCIHHSALSSYVERSVFLPRTWWCYRPPAEVLEIAPLPAFANGHLTFGCLNNFCKISGATLDAWCELLKRVDDSQLIIHAGKGIHQQIVRDRFAAAGVDPQRLEFAGFVPLVKYFAVYNRIDIALDPFPYTGGTTTCDALWMGVPTVTLSGRTAVSRGGASILSNMRLGELIAHSTDQYIQIAADLARNLPLLSHWRQTLRTQMQQSPLMDEPQFARDIEAAYRMMWRAWCNETSG